jgi:hypothetical protein
MTLSPLLPNILRILVLVEASNKSSKLSFRVLLPEPVISITSMSWIRLSLIWVKSRIKPADLIVGAYGAKSSAGKSYVIFGKTDTGAIDLSKLGDKSKYTIDYLGDKNANILTGTTTGINDDVVVA